MMGLIGGLSRVRVSDTVTRADSATTSGSAETGQLYVAQSGTWGVSSNKLYLVTATVQASEVVDGGCANGTLTADVTLSATADRADTGIVFRDTDDNNYLLLQVLKNVATNALRLFKRDAGTFTQLAQVNPAGLANGTTYTFEIVLVDNSVTINQDGVFKISYTLTGDEITKFGTQTQLGPRVNTQASADDGGSRIDNLKLVV